MKRNDRRSCLLLASMASPFVPVDLDKLLDEFEETEEETKPEQLVLPGAGNIASRKQLAKQSFQVSFPSIEEEVFSDQRSDGHRLDDRTSSDSDNDSISGVIKEAEAITNQGDCFQAQSTPGVIDNISGKLKENVTVGDTDFKPTSNDNSLWSTIEGSNSEDVAVNEGKNAKKVAHAQWLEEESAETSNSIVAGGLSDVDCNNFASKKVAYSAETSCPNDVTASSLEESCSGSGVTGTASHTDGERHKSSEEKIGPVESTFDAGQLHDSGLQVVDSDVRTSDPEISNDLVGGVNFAALSCDSQRGSVDFMKNVPSLLENQAIFDPRISDGGHQDSGISDISEAVHLSDLSLEVASDTTNAWPMVLVSDSSLSQVHEAGSSNLESYVQPSVPSQDQADSALNEAGSWISKIPEDVDDTRHHMEANDASNSETQVSRDHQVDMRYDLSPSAPDYGEPASEFNHIDTEAIDGNEGSIPLPNELDYEQSPSWSQEPGLTIAMDSQGSLAARRITSGEANLGKVPPIWVPDSVATHCMNCGVKFSVIKRRHHCRACGKALCSSCCNMKFMLPYMDNREGRVCQVCCNALLRAEALMHVTETQSIENLTAGYDNPTEDLTLDHDVEEDELVPVDPEEEITEAAEAVGDDSSAAFATAAVDQTSEDTVSGLPLLQLPVLPSPDVLGTPLSTPTSPALSDDSDCLFRLDVDNVRSLLPQDTTALPPVLRVVNEEVSIHERPDPAEIMYLLKGLHETVIFLLNKNLVVKVSIVKLSCCVKRKCWCFVSEGMGAANQEEMVVLLECLHKETMIPKDVLSHFNTAFAYARQGHTVSELGYTIFGQPFLGSSDNAGFLYIKPTYQCLKNLPLPLTPYVVGLLIKRQETPWAQLFPLRLQLRLGAEYRYYPCPLFSSRNRSPVYGEVGHTIMNLLADFKNFQYTLVRVTGLVIHMEEKKTLVRLPQDRYDEVVKILNATDEHVMALGANFSLVADSHLVCMQVEQGYKTQAINIQNQPRKVTGASFIVFSGALKTSSPFMAKVNIVEDGIMVQLMPEVIGKLRNSLKEMKDYTITTGVPGGGAEEEVIIEWVSRQDAPRQDSFYSPIDGLELHGFSSVKVHTGCDFTRKSAFRIQWTEMFFLGEGQQSASRDINKLTAELAKAFCRTLIPHLSRLSSENFTDIGLRVNVDTENVGYNTGSNQQSLPSNIMSELDDLLIPIIHNAASHHRRRALNVELLFKVLRLL